MEPIIDVACGARMFWFDKHNPNVVFCDKRRVPYHEFYPNRYIEVNPDITCDFTHLPFADKTFKLVVFDPPHLTRVGASSWTYLKYGRLEGNWPQMIHDGFQECMRVLVDYGVLVFKWSEVQISLKDILKAIGQEPLFGNRSGKHGKTHWLCFMKLEEYKYMGQSFNVRQRAAPRRNEKLVRYMVQQGCANQLDFARRAQVSPATVSNWLYGRDPSVRDVAQLADIFHTPIAELYKIFNITEDTKK